MDDRSNSLSQNWCSLFYYESGKRKTSSVNNLKSMIYIFRNVRVRLVRGVEKWEDEKLVGG